VYFTTMIDLYGIHPDFPGLAEAEKLRHVPYQRVEYLEGCFGQDVRDPRFVPFIELHEFETYLFAGPQHFADFYPEAEKQIAALQAAADAHQSPELIDDGEHSAPSKRIIAQIPDFQAAKATIGPDVAQLIGLDQIVRQCPHFRAWLSRLETLGSV
jgi:hypothetical protein